MRKSENLQKPELTITALKQQIKNPDRVSVFVNNTYSFSLSLGEILTQKLKVGIVFTAEDISRLKKVSSDGKLRFRALNWVTLRPRSARELRQYLARISRKKPVPRDPGKKPREPLEVSAELADSLVGDFEKRGYVDDRRFAEWWVGRRLSQKKSQTILRLELSQKGISREIQSEVLEGSDGDALKALIEKLQNKPKYADRDRLVRYCMSKGFRYSDVVDALAALDSDD